MGFEFFKEAYSGGIKEISLGTADNAVTVGGETCYPFYQFEGESYQGKSNFRKAIRENEELKDKLIKKLHEDR